MAAVSLLCGRARGSGADERSRFAMIAGTADRPTKETFGVSLANASSVALHPITHDVWVTCSYLYAVRIASGS